MIKSDCQKTCPAEFLLCNLESSLAEKSESAFLTSRKYKAGNRRSDPRKGRPHELKLDFVLREIAGETLLVPAGKTALDLNGMLTLNETGAALWRMLPEAADAEALTQGLLQEFEGAPAEQVRADVEEFLARLRELGIVE